MTDATRRARRLQLSRSRAYHCQVGAVDPLDAIKIVSPCTVPWASMAGDERVRHCDQCKKDVYNLAAMTADEARALIEKSEGRVCLRLARRADGTLVTGDCRTRLRAARQRGMITFASTLVVMLAVEIWAQAFGLRALSDFLRGDPKPPPPTVTQDAIDYSLVDRAIDRAIADSARVDRAPAVRAPRPKRSSRLAVIREHSYEMGDVPLDGL